jgi:ribosomal-protein-alanine N-acetyltransferase
MKEADLDAVSALAASLQDHPWARGNFADSLAAGHAGWVLRSDGEVIGFSVVMTVVDEAHLLNIGVDRRHQGQGHGARLLRQIIEDARSAGAVRLLLEVRRSNQQAIDFYRHFAFMQVAVRRAYYPTLAGREDALLFDKDLQ